MSRLLDSSVTCNTYPIHTKNGYNKRPRGVDSSDVVVSAANLPVEYRPFGGDRIRVVHFDDMMTGRRRSIRVDAVSFAEWLLQSGTLASPT